MIERTHEATIYRLGLEVDSYENRSVCLLVAPIA